MMKRILVSLSLLLVTACAPESSGVRESYDSDGYPERSQSLTWQIPPKKENPGPVNYDRDAPVPESATRDLLPSGGARN